MPTIPPYLTLFDATLRLARELVLVRQGKATDGTLTTLVDSTSKFQLDSFGGGTLFLLEDSIFKTITQHSGSTFTFAAVSDSPDAGDDYAVADNDIPLDVMVAAINSALRSLELPDEDVTTVTVASQEEYTLPNNVRNLYKVEVATSLTSPYGYQEHFNWYEVDGKLRFEKDAPGSAGYLIRLTFRAVSIDLTAESDTIPNGVNADYLHWKAVQDAAKYGQRVHFADPKRDWNSKVQEAEVRLQRLSSKQPKPQRSPKLSNW